MKTMQADIKHTDSTSDSDLAGERKRGRSAERPSEIPAQGWLDVAWRTARRFSDDNVTLIAGGLAMYALLSVFPALAAMVSIYGMFATPGDVIKQMSAFAGVLPPGVWDIFNTELQSIAKTGQSTLTVAAALGLVVALWSARSAMSSLMTATNIAYREHEKRGFIRQTLLSLGFTVGAIVGFLLMLTLGLAIPLALAAFGAEEWTKAVVSALRVALLWLVIVFGLAVIYRYAPAREQARWRWVSPGSLVAATVLLGATALFGFYVTNFAGYAKTYGALGGVVVMLMWFFISSIVVVVGAQINAESERQTVKDTTVREDAPMGHRGAFAADTVGPTTASGKSSVRDHGRSNEGVRRTHKGLPSRTRNNSNWIAHSARTASRAGALVKRAAVVASHSCPTHSRISAVISTAGLTARLLPTGLRLLRRHPVGSSLALMGILWMTMNTRESTTRQDR
jgi:membrane protein